MKEKIYQMRQTIKLPKLGDTVDKVLVIKIHRAVGDLVEADESLMSVETDKIEVDVPCPVSGRIVEILVVADSEVATGSPIVVVETVF